MKSACRERGSSQAAMITDFYFSLAAFPFPPSHSIFDLLLFLGSVQNVSPFQFLHFMNDDGHAHQDSSPYSTAGSIMNHSNRISMDLPAAQQGRKRELVLLFCLICHCKRRILVSQKGSLTRVILAAYYGWTPRCDAAMYLRCDVLCPPIGFTVLRTEAIKIDQC